MSKFNHNKAFLQEKHCSIKKENEWVNDISFLVFFPGNASNSCGILIGYLGKTFFVLNKQKTDKAGKFLILDITLHADHYIFINLCNGNTKIEQVKILGELQSLLINLDIGQNKRIIFAGDFNIYFNSKL